MHTGANVRSAALCFGSRQGELDAPSRLEAVKLTGDEHVPAGELTWTAALPLGSSLAHRITSS